MSGETPLARDTAFGVMSNSRRRFILSTLREADAPVELMRLARGIGAQEAGTSPDDIDTAEQKRIYVSLYQTHIPTLEAAGLVEYDETERTVAPTTSVTETDRYLGPIAPVVPWPRFSGATAGVTGLALVGAALAGSAVAVPPTLVATLVVGLLTVVTAAQCLDYRRRANTRPPELR
ncbi:DUF7344 domain-containing protein [Haloarcula marina]|uniref:DUF7344 domain-containing protein n=1 Tax=Haloarcula marina TaxID=2961574 RepID=UPI0020B645F3|nr:hypothetical protein [Halomicroarcula marina]